MKDWVGLTVGEARKRARVNFRDVTFIDEPPGKLRGLSFPYQSEGVNGEVTLKFRYQPELFSLEREWPPALVEAQTITEVLWDQGDQV